MAQLMACWRHQAITSTNVDLSSNVLCHFHLRTILREMFKNLIRDMGSGIKLLNSQLCFPRVNKFIGQVVHTCVSRPLRHHQFRPSVIHVHYTDVIMGAIASQITNLTIVYSTVYSDADQRKHHSSASLAFVWGIHRGPVNSPHKWPVTRKMFPFDDVIMSTHVTTIFHIVNSCVFTSSEPW